MIILLSRSFFEYRYSLKVYTVQLTIPANNGKVLLARRLRSCIMHDFLHLWNSIGSLGRRSNPINDVNLQLDLDLVVPEVALDLVGISNWDFEASVIQERKKTWRFFRLQG